MFRWFGVYGCYLAANWIWLCVVYLWLLAVALMWFVTNCCCFCCAFKCWRLVLVVLCVHGSHGWCFVGFIVYLFGFSWLLVLGIGGFVFCGCYLRCVAAV